MGLGQFLNKYDMIPSALDYKFVDDLLFWKVLKTESMKNMEHSCDGAHNHLCVCLFQEIQNS